MSDDIQHLDFSPDLSTLARPDTPPTRWRAGRAIRRDWPDGTHELVGFRDDEAAATRFLDGDRRFWRRGPLRPTAWRVVEISRRDFELHGRRRECRSPDCPA